MEAMTVTVQDGQIAAAWGMTLQGWLMLTDDLRRDYRDRVTFAPYFRTVMGR